MPSHLPKRAGASEAGVVVLDEVRERQVLARWRERVAEVLEHNRLAFERLHASGLLFTRHGARTGRELLQAHQHLLRVSDLVTKAERGEAGDMQALRDLSVEVEQLLEKAASVARRYRNLFPATRPGDGRP